jgi:hypothetical protein
MVKRDFIINKGISGKNRQRIAGRGTCTGGQKKDCGAGGKVCYHGIAFVALVSPLDSILEGLRVQTRGLFCFTAGGSREAANNFKSTE